MSSAETIAQALGGYKSGTWWRCRCPSHGSSSRSMALRDTASGLRVRCFARCTDKSVIDALCRLNLYDGKAADPETIEQQREADERNRTKRIAAAAALWRQTEPANWLIETYLGGRLILAPIPATLRLHRGLRHRESGGIRPAMVGAVEHVEHGFVGVHVTYLQPNGEGKATVEPVKRFIGPVGGGAVRLAPVAGTIAVSEGIESGLSYMEATGTPTWCALSAGSIRQLILPAEVQHVVIAADPDPIGIMAARAAARRWLAEGRRVSIARPPVGLDFNDMARVVLG